MKHFKDKEQINHVLFASFAISGAIAGSGIWSLLLDSALPEYYEFVGIAPLVIGIYGLIFMGRHGRHIPYYESGLVNMITTFSLGALLPFAFPHYDIPVAAGGLNINFFVALAIGMVGAILYNCLILKPLQQPPQ